MEALREALREALAGLPGGGGGGREEAEAFDRARFWEALAGAFGAASREATRLSLAAAAARDSQPQTCERLSEEVRVAVLGAVSVSRQLPPSQGKTLNNAVRCATIQVVEGMIQLTEVILRTPQESLSQEQLISTGGVWEACDRVSCLPPDNLAAVTLAISSCLELVKDALEEMEQMQAEGGASPGDLLEDEVLGLPGNCALVWTDAERQLLGPCMGLVKATKAGLKKLLGAMRAHGGADTEEHVAQLDALAEAAAELSPSVDELVLGLCPPVNQLTLRLNAGKLASVLMRMLEITRTSHVCPPSEESWVRFLAGAVDHNLGKIKDSTQGLLGDPGPAGEGLCLGDARPKEQP
ncbi:cyclin-D1-binding protein 1 [Protobothrops mucrosquamatus]|uniref:cyclin-D1-binding protein 1 n=1 Tax=Protobothrops mucrosquamatus TaxID=103944 RepID=UPI0010FB4428|nr:cyclin-D1-binding protein 1 [Protobothrops mucrosquamatus]